MPTRTLTPTAMDPITSADHVELPSQLRHLRGKLLRRNAGGTMEKYLLQLRAFAVSGRDGAVKVTTHRWEIFVEKRRECRRIFGEKTIRSLEESLGMDSRAIDAAERGAP